MTKITTEKTVSIEKIGIGKRAVRVKQRDARDEQEESALQRHRAETARINEFNRDLRANRQMRYTYAKAVFRFLIGYSAFAGIVLLLDGWGSLTGFSLPAVVLTALVGSTAASAIGLVAIVVTGLFRSHQGERKP